MPDALAPSPAPRRGRWLLVAVALFLAAGVGIYFLIPRPQVQPAPDLEAAAAANARGVGLMERFEYEAAEKEFERALVLAPDWLPAKVNAGIALFNQQPADQKSLSENVNRAQRVFREVLARDPDNKHAHYCLGMIALYVGQLAEAYGQFAAVERLDPDDAHTNLRLGATHPDGANSPAAAKYYERALALNPYLNEARYRLAFAQPDADRRGALLAEHEKLQRADRFAESRIVYAEMGKYADVIGRVPGVQAAIGPLPLFEAALDFRVTLAPGARWATAADLDAAGRAARVRFGGTVVLFDYDGDGRPDVFCASTIVEAGKVRDLLLRNEPGGTFRDVTAAMGFVGASLGAAAGDFDNDGKPDFAVTGAAGVRLFRNEGGRFADVSIAAGFDKLEGAVLGCVWTDIDQDGDLDLAACQTAEGAGVTLFENVGVAPPTPPNVSPPPLSVAFRPGQAFAAVAPRGSAAAAVATDIDGDIDPDLLILGDGAEPVVVQNDRLMRFTQVRPKWRAGRWNGGLVLDANHNGRSDLFLVRADAAPLFLTSYAAKEFEPGVTNSPPLRQAVATDIDLDGWADVVGLAADGKPVLLHNRAAKLEVAPEAFGPVEAGHAVAVADLNGDTFPDLLIWGDAGMRLYRNRGNGNAALLVEPTGRRDNGSNLRTPADGTGTWLVAQAGTLWTGAERATVSAGLGQSLLPTPLGLGKHGRADTLRIRWPDAVIQAELDIPAGVAKVVETNRKGTSCPVLLAWDGTRFGFVTDFLGVGALGESGPGGSTRTPRGSESVKIEPGQLTERDGQFVIKIAEPMDEVLYLDHLRLDVIDHPASAPVYPDERFVFTGPEPTQKLLAFPSRHLPTMATDDRGRDVTAAIRERDRDAVDDFPRRSWLGYAANHSVTLDFSELPAGKRLSLVLAGWTEYPYPESMVAATRAGVELLPPVLEREQSPGNWVKVGDLGFPAGLPRVMTRDLPADFRGGRVRISTNMQVFWDQIWLAEAEDADKLGTVTPLPVAHAELNHRGFMREVTPGGRGPVAYDDSRTEPVAVTDWKGNLTKLGDVTDLLRAADDRLTVCGPGDEITVRFDAKSLPKLPAGRSRSFVLRTRGYCKDTSVTTVTGGSVDPLPFVAMPNYPDFGDAKPPASDDAMWRTRPAGGR